MVAGDVVTVIVQLQREADDDEDEGKVKKNGDLPRAVCSTRYPGAAGASTSSVASIGSTIGSEVKLEGWWLVVGDRAKNSLLTVKRLTFGCTAKSKLEFTAPEIPGDHALTLSLVSDSYLGCDLEFAFPLRVLAADEDNESAMST